MDAKKSVKKTSFAIAKWVSPFGFFQSHTKQFQRRYIDIDPLLDAYEKAKAEDNHDEIANLSSEISRLHSVSTAGVATALLVLIGALTAFYQGIGDAQREIYLLFSGLLLCIASYLFKVHHDAKKRLSSSFAEIKEQNSKQEKMQESDTEFQLLFFQAKVASYTYLLIAVALLFNFIDVDTLAALQSSDLSSAMITTLIALLGSFILFARSAIALKDTRLIRAKIINLDLLGFYNLSQNINPLYCHGIAALTISLALGVALDFATNLVPTGLITAATKIAFWLAGLWIAFCAFKTYQNYIEMTPGSQNEGFNLTSVVSGRGIKLPLPDEHNMHISPASTARFFGVVLSVAAILIGTGWAQLLISCAVMLLAAILLATADIRESIDER